MSRSFILVPIDFTLCDFIYRLRRTHHLTTVAYICHVTDDDRRRKDATLHTVA